MQLNKFKLSGDFRVTHTTGGVEDWDFQIDLFKAGKAATTKAFNNLHFFSLLNGALFGANISEDLAISNIFIDDGDGATTAFSGTAPLLPVKTGTFTVTDGTETFTDNGDSTLTGDAGGSGSINYVSGAYSVTFNAAPAASDNVLMSYTRGTTGDDTIMAGFTFFMTTDAAPTTGEGNWTNIVPLPIMPQKVDKYENASSYIYKVTMTGQYTGAATDAVTGIGIAYEAVEGAGGGVTAMESTIIKSIAPKDNALYPSGTLVLSDTTDLVVTYYVTIEK